MLHSNWFSSLAEIHFSHENSPIAIPWMEKWFSRQQSWWRQTNVNYRRHVADCHSMNSFLVDSFAPCAIATSLSTSAWTKREKLEMEMNSDVHLPSNWMAKEWSSRMKFESNGRGGEQCKCRKENWRSDTRTSFVITKQKGRNDIHCNMRRTLEGKMKCEKITWKILCFGDAFASISFRACSTIAPSFLARRKYTEWRIRIGHGHGCIKRRVIERNYHLRCTAQRTHTRPYTLLLSFQLGECVEKCFAPVS